MLSQNRLAHDLIDIDAIEGQVIGHDLIGDILAVNDQGTEAMLLNLLHCSPHRRHLVYGPHVRWHYFANLDLRYEIHSSSSISPVNIFNWTKN